MAVQEAYEICEYRWKDEVEYAETLRERRKLLTTVMIVAIGLGMFRVDMYIDPSEVSAITNPAVKNFMKICVILAVFSYFVGSIYLFKGSQNGEDAPRRASELLELSDEEVDNLSQQENNLSVSLKTEKLRAATLSLSGANRRVSKNLKLAGFLIGMGYAFLTVNALAYTLFRVDGTRSLERSFNLDEGKHNEHTIEQKAKGKVEKLGIAESDFDPT